jgi:hypothetical protein
MASGARTAFVNAGKAEHFEQDRHHHRTATNAKKAGQHAVTAPAMLSDTASRIS